MDAWQRADGELALFGRRGAGRAGATGSPSADRDMVVSSGLMDRLAEREEAAHRLRRRRAVAAVAALVAVAVVVWAVAFSPLLALRADQVRVTGADGTVSDEDVRQAVSAQVGRSLLLLDLGQVEREVEGSVVRVRTARAVRSWPHGVRVEVTVRQPVAARATAAGFEVLDAEAVVLDLQEQEPEGLVRVQAPGDPAPGGSGAGQPEAGAAASVPELTAAQVAAVTGVVGALDETVRARVVSGAATTAGHVTLTLDTGAQVVWGDASQNALKATVLRVLLANQASTYDVSSPRSPTTS